MQDLCERRHVNVVDVDGGDGDGDNDDNDVVVEEEEEVRAAVQRAGLKLPSYPTTAPATKAVNFKKFEKKFRNE